MADDIQVSSSSKRVDTDKGAEQAERLKKIAQKKAADNAEADKERRRQQEAAQEAARQAAQQEEKAREAAALKAQATRANVEKIGAAALSVGGAVAHDAVENVRKGNLKITPKLIVPVVVVLLVVVVALALAWPKLAGVFFAPEQPTTATELSAGKVMGSVNAQIGEAVLGQARQKQDLVVWEQDVQVDSSITSALANLAIFSKTKTVHSFGTGVYTVDMGAIDEDSVQVDQDAQRVTLSIPHARLQYVTKDLEKTQFEDTKHALLGFGDVKLTQEQQNILERSIEDAMRKELETSECFADADEAALLVVYDAYQPLIAKVDSSYTLEVAFAG